VLYLHSNDLLTVCAVRSEVRLQSGDQKPRSIAGNFHVEEAACGVQVSKAALGIVSFLLVLHSQLLVYGDFRMMGQIMSASMGRCKEQTQSEGLEGCGRLLLRFCP